MATRPPRVTSTRRQPTTRGGPRPRGPSYISGWQNIRVGGKPLGGTRVPAASAPSAVPVAPAVSQYSLSNLPPDASYDAAIAGLQRQRGDTLAGLTQARTSGLSDYGFQEGPNGALTFDPNNPFSKAAVMKKSYDTNRRSNAQSLGAGGQQYSGAFQNAQDLVNRNQVQGEDALQKSLIGFLARNTQGVTQANTGYETAAGQAYGDRVSRFGENPLYDPASAQQPVAPVNAAAVPAASTSKRPKRPKGVGASAISGYYRP